MVGFAHSTRRRLAAGLCLVVASLAPARAVDEYELKGAFLYNFAKFVHWPPEAFETSGDQIVLCLLDDPSRGALERSVSGKTAQDKVFSVRNVSGADELAGCHILFVGASSPSHGSKLLDRARDHHVLTVGESDRFALLGGVIGVFMEGSRVRFEVNADAAERAGLQISSQLLELATHVIAAPTGEDEAEP